MKLLLRTLTLSLLTLPLLLSAHTDDADAGCHDGASGWWLRLDSSADYQRVQGGIYTSSGNYWGCGTCGECRTDLQRRIDSTLDTLKKNCEVRGGQVKSSSPGKWEEQVSETYWIMTATEIGHVCEKWVACD